MGRRARTRARSAAARTEATAGTARRDPPAPGGSAPGGATGTGQSTGRRVLAILNPLKGTSRRRVVWAAIAFALLGLVLAAVGLVADRPEWYRSAMLLGLLALVWGVRASFMSDRQP